MIFCVVVECVARFSEQVPSANCVDKGSERCCVVVCAFWVLSFCWFWVQATCRGVDFGVPEIGSAPRVLLDVTQFGESVRGRPICLIESRHRLGRTNWRFERICINLCRLYGRNASINIGFGRRFEDYFIGR